MAPALSVREVGKTFPTGLTALTGVSLEVTNGGFASLLGTIGLRKIHTPENDGGTDSAI